MAPPPGPREWDVRFADNDAAKGWEELCRQAPGNTLAAWMTMRRNPVPPMDAPRHHRLRHNLATGLAKGRVLDHWQIEVTGAGRIWYLVDHDSFTVWIDHAGPAHPEIRADHAGPAHPEIRADHAGQPTPGRPD